MKKYLAFAIIGLLSVTMVFGDTDIDPEDFLYLTPANEVLYPELDYKSNPAVLSDINENLLLVNLDFTAAYAESLKTRIDDSVGLLGGTEIISSFSMSPGGDLTMFFPLEDGSLFGFDLFYDSEHSSDRADSLNYNGVTENKKILTDENIYNAGTDLYFAMNPAKEFDLGFSLGYNLNYDPAVFKWVTDSTISPALQYTEPLLSSDNFNELTNGLNAAVGVTLPFDNYKLLLGVVYNGSYKDGTDELVEVDTNADGYKDTPYSLSDYYALAASAGGPAEAVTGHSFIDYTLVTAVDLNAAFFWEIDESTSMILSGRYDVMDYTYNHYAKHVLTGTVLTDDSYLDKIYDSGLGSFNANIGFDFEDKENNSCLRIGLGYSRWAERYSQDGDTVAGLMLFSSQNTGNYTELSLGTEPINNALVDASLYPSEREIHQIGLNAGWRWIPERVVTIFFDFGVSAFHDTNTYRAFNLDTLTVWEEKVVAAEISWLITSAAGVSFPLGEEFICTLDLQNIGTIGDASLTDETHMYDQTLDRISTNGIGFLQDNNALNVKLDITFEVSW
ncbi:MAG: hypothetical protein JEZ04_14975 [Spirochaetales bacterium]|nr:hypothetical protein [Spirochaetales bacterium]